MGGLKAWIMIRGGLAGYTFAAFALVEKNGEKEEREHKPRGSVYVGVPLRVIIRVDARRSSHASRACFEIRFWFVDPFASVFRPPPPVSA